VIFPPGARRAASPAQLPAIVEESCVQGNSARGTSRWNARRRRPASTGVTKVPAAASRSRSRFRWRPGLAISAQLSPSGNGIRAGRIAILEHLHDEALLPVRSSDDRLTAGKVVVALPGARRSYIARLAQAVPSPSQIVNKDRLDPMPQERHRGQGGRPSHGVERQRSRTGARAEALPADPGPSGRDSHNGESGNPE